MEQIESMQKTKEVGKANVVMTRKPKSTDYTVFGKTYNSSEVSELIGKEKSYMSYARSKCEDHEHLRMCIVTIMREIGLEKFGITVDNEPNIIAYFPSEKKGPIIKINNKWMPLQYWNKEIGRSNEYLSRYYNKHNKDEKETRDFIIKCLKEKDPNFKIRINVEFDEKSNRFIIDDEKYALVDISKRLLNKSEGYLFNHRNRYFNNKNSKEFLEHIAEELEAKYNNETEHQTSLSSKNNNIIRDKVEEEPFLEVAASKKVPAHKNKINNEPVQASKKSVADIINTNLTDKQLSRVNDIFLEGVGNWCAREYIKRHGEDILKAMELN